MSVPEMKPTKADELSAAQTLAFSICTLVTRPEEYDEMRASFESHGFVGADCEYLYLDNSKTNAYSAYSGLNLFLSVARGRLIILCHQDIELLVDDRASLERTTNQLSQLDPTWAVCGNSGGVWPGGLAIRLTDPHGHNRRTMPLPARVDALDENFIVVRRDANLALSSDLTGFHLYGTDLCIVADVLGRSAYVIDFHLLHKSGGTRDHTLIDSRRRLVDKYARAFRPRWVTAPCEIVFLSGISMVARFLSARMVTGLLYRLGGSMPGLMRQLFRSRFAIAQPRADDGKSSHP